MVSNILSIFLATLCLLIAFNSKILFVEAENEDNVDWDNSSSLQAELLEIFGRLIQASIDSHKSSLNESCYYQLTYLFTKGPDSINHFYTIKTLLDSSKNKNDLSYFTYCMRKKYKFSNKYPQLVNMTFLITKIDKTTKNSELKNSSIYPTLNYYIGLCIPNVCNKDDFQSLFLGLNSNLNDILYLDGDNSIVELIPFNNISPPKDAKFFLSMIPLFIFILFCIFMILLFITPNLIMKCCFKSKRFSNLKEEKQNIGKYNKQLFNKFRSCFNFSQNWEELFNYTVMSSHFNSFSGLANTIGLRAISMILVIFGFTFYDLLNNVSGVYGQYAFIEILQSFFYPIFYIGLKYSPRILFSCSGYVLFYKFMCFLDDNIEEANSNTSKFLSVRKQTITESIYAQDEKSDILKHFRKVRNIKVKYLMKFFLYQLPKYIIFVLMSLFLRFTLYNIVERSPMWEIVKRESLSENSTIGFLLTFIGVHLFDPSDRLINSRSVFNFNYIIYNEMIFFIFGCLLLYFANKYNLRIDRYVLIFTPFFIVVKFCLFLYLHFKLKYYSTLYYYTFDYAKLMINPLFNLPYFMIGFFFGSLNYVVQKGIDYDEAEEQYKEFLYLSVRYVNFFRKVKKIVVIIVFIIMGSSITFILLINRIFINIEKEKDKSDNLLLSDFIVNPFINIIMSFDIEIFVFSVQWISTCFYIRGNNVINDFLIHSFWTIFEKIYFSFALSVQPVILYILCHSRSRIQIKRENVIFYSLISLIMELIIAVISYLIIELPSKRMLKFFIAKEKDLAVEKEDNELNEGEEEDLVKFQ